MDDALSAMEDLAEWIISIDEVPVAASAKGTPEVAGTLFVR